MSPDIYTFRARTLAEALLRVREQLGPDAAVLATRRLASPLMGFLGGITVEVTASAGMNVPSRLPVDYQPNRGQAALTGAAREDCRQKIRHNLRQSGRFEASLIEQLASVNAPLVR